MELQLKFYDAVLDFLRSEYSDAYNFKIERYTALPPALNPFNRERVELKIDISPMYRLTIVNDSMTYLFKLYCDGTFLEDRGQYLWQKELIDMIEGS